MLIYLGTWTLSAPPYAEEIADNYGLKFNQCSFNWWDHSLAIGTEKRKIKLEKILWKTSIEYIYSNIEIFLPGEILFLAWGIKVCYNVRNAESLFNEARLISYAIYNIAAVNITMIAIQYEFLFIFFLFSFYQ